MHISIVPVPVFPVLANRLYVRAGSLGPPPSFYWELQRVSPVPAVPAVLGVGFPGEIGYRPARDEIPAGESVECLKNGNVDMPEADWNAWAASDLDPKVATAADRKAVLESDESYILASIAKTLGLEIKA